MKNPEAVTKDIDPKEQAALLIKSYIGSVLFTGFMLGFGFCICFVGALKQFEETIVRYETANEILKNWWFQPDWWFWFGPLFVLIILYIITSRYSKKRLVKNIVGEKYGNV